MARLPPVKRLNSEDFKDQTSWISKLILPLNQFMDAIVAGLNKGLTFADNFAAQVKSLEFTQGTAIYPQSFLCTLPSRPAGLWISDVKDLEGTPATLTTAVWADWEYANGQVKIKNISGLTTGRKYRVSFIIIAG